jgi:hypothetical protein
MGGDDSSHHVARRQHVGKTCCRPRSVVPTLAHSHLQLESWPVRSSVMRTRVPMWVAGISVCLLAASGTVAVIRAIPASYASIPDERALSEHGAVASGSEDANANEPQAHLAIARDTINRRNRAWCHECGVVESVRQIAGSGGASGNPMAASAITSKGYEITVRFRDGTTTVFNEASPRTWRLGSRVIVIGRSNVSYD